MKKVFRKETTLKFPDKLQSGPVHLQLRETVPGNKKLGLVPYYHFSIHDAAETPVGHINLRIGDTRHITLCAGHVGYEILPQFRGHAYSYHACQALAPLIRLHYKSVLITTDLDNTPSKRILEKLGANFLGVVTVPAEDPANLEGSRRKLRYSWTPDQPHEEQD